MGYRWAQFEAYLRLARRRAARDRADRLVDANVAFAGGEAATKLHKGLLDAARQAERD